MAAELFINNTKVDVDSGTTFALTFQISDIKNPEKRKGFNSKTISLPGTSKNSQLFSSIFVTSTSEITDDQGSGFLSFDPTVKASCRYLEDSILQFNGVCQLLSCEEENGTRRFQISMFSDFINFMNEMKKNKVQELDWSEYTHELTYENVTKTWEGQVRVNGVFQESFSNLNLTTFNGIGYYYGTVDYGFTRPNETTFRIEQLPPQVYVYEILKKSFEKAGFTFESNFLESVFFKKQLSAWQGGKIPSVTTAEQAQQSVFTEEQNSITGGFNIVAPLLLPTYYNPPEQGSPPDDTIFYSIQNGDPVFSSTHPFNADVITDVQLQTVDDYPFLVELKNDGIYDITYSGQVTIDARIENQAGVAPDNVYDSFLSCTYSLVIKKNNVVYETVQLGLYYGSVISGNNFPSQVIAFDETVTIQLDQGENLSFELKIEQAPSTGSFDYNTPQPDDYQFNAIFESSVQVGTEPTLDIKKTAANFIPGQDVLLRYFVPQMDCAQFFTGILKMYNLTAEPKIEDPTIIKIEPLEDFYGAVDDAENWTKDMDRKKKVKIVPTSAIASREYTFEFQDDKTEFNERYVDQAELLFGNRVIDSNVDYATKTTATKLPFSNEPIVLLPTTTNFIMPRKVKESNGVFIPKKGKPFIVFKGVDNDAGTHLTDCDNWNLIDENGFAQLQTSYPYIGHLDSVEDSTFDLVFKRPEFVFFNLVGLYTSNNLYQYHSRFVNEIVDKFGRILEAHFNIDREQINKLDFSTLKNIEGVIYRLQKIDNYDWTLNTSTKCELIKVQDSIF